jgi:regulatory protein
MTLLRYRPRSIAEARQRLTERGYEREVIEETLQQAIATEQLDDAAFAKLWVRDRMWHHPMSRAAVSQELRGKGIPPDLIAATLSSEYPEVREVELAMDLARTRMQRLRGVPRDKRAARLLSYLSRRGFSRGLAIRAVRSAEEAFDHDNGESTHRDGV